MLITGPRAKGRGCEQRKREGRGDGWKSEVNQGKRKEVRFP